MPKKTLQEKTTTSNLLPTEHAVALFEQAGAIRRAAMRLEREARNPSQFQRAQQTRIQHELGTIRVNLDALIARFGKADR